MIVVPTILPSGVEAFVKIPPYQIHLIVIHMVDILLKEDDDGSSSMAIDVFHEHEGDIENISFTQEQLHQLIVTESTLPELQRYYQVDSEGTINMNFLKVVVDLLFKHKEFNVALDKLANAKSQTSDDFVEFDEDYSKQMSEESLVTTNEILSKLTKS